MVIRKGSTISNDSYLVKLTDVYFSEGVFVKIQILITNFFRLETWVILFSIGWYLSQIPQSEQDIYKLFNA